MARPSRHHSLQLSPTQSGLLRMAAKRLCPEITNALAGLHDRGGAWTGACSHNPLLPRRTQPAPQLLPAIINVNLAHEARSMDPE